MKPKSVKIIDSFQINGRGLIAELQHFENGIPPHSVLTDVDTGNSWIVKKRVLSGILLLDDSEIFFDCETEFEHISAMYSTIEERKKAVQKEINKRNERIYLYLLSPKVKKERPSKGSILNILVP